MDVVAISRRHVVDLFDGHNGRDLGRVVSTPLLFRWWIPLLLQARSRFRLHRTPAKTDLSIDFIACVFYIQLDGSMTKDGNHEIPYPMVEEAGSTVETTFSVLDVIRVL